MGAMRFCLLLFCLFLVSNSSPVTKRNDICLPRPHTGQGQNRLFSKVYYKFLGQAPTPIPTPCRLDNIEVLTNTGYGKPSPRHGLQLLFWFAQILNVDQNKMLLMFDPTEKHYGFHSFRNDESLLPQLDKEQRYFEVGNLNENYLPEGCSKLPDYVKKEYKNNKDQERNMDRLVISLDINRSLRVHKVFITAHNHGKRYFNPSDTYEIDPALILQIRTSYCNNAHTSQHNTEEQRCNQFLTATKATDCEKSSAISTTSDNPRKKRSPYSQCNTYEGIKLEIKTTTQGYTKVIWKNIPADIMKKYKNLLIDICQNTHSRDPNEDPTQVRKKYFPIQSSSGALDTSVSLNAGLQPRIMLGGWVFFSRTVIWNGPEFDGANGVIPTRIKGLDASLQLYALNGKASARLYIKKTFSDWNSATGVLYHTWVGFYKSSQDKNDGYYTYQYAVNFAIIGNTNYYIYQYDSNLAIAPGVQIRLLYKKIYNNVLAQTTPWERDEKMTSVCDKGNLRTELWSYPEFFYEPEFYDANNVLPIKIQMYDAGLQLFTKDLKACARLYIKKTFTDWKNTFYNSWVGFYISSQNTNKQYETYQYAVDFEKMDDGTKNFDVYQFKSELAIAPGVQIRFMKDKEYDKKLVETEPWKSG